MDNSTTIEVPCKDCVCIAICRNKLFDAIISECRLLLDALYFDRTTTDGARSKYFGNKVIMIYNMLQPEYWKIEIDEKGFTNILINKEKDIESPVVNYRIEMKVEANKRGAFFQTLRSRKQIKRIERRTTDEDKM